MPFATSWPLSLFRKPPAVAGGTIEGIYGMIVAQAREPLFYSVLGVRDTVNGRFDLLLLHLWMVLRRLRSGQGCADLAQPLFDHFCGDMDDNLREMGVGDLTVPKRMRKFGEAFYGRSTAYDLALSGPVEDLALALDKNVYGGGDPDHAARLADYVRRAAADLARFGDTAFSSGQWSFPAVATSELAP